MQEKKKQRKKWKRTHCSCAIQKRVTHDICIIKQGMLPCKTIKAISIRPSKADEEDQQECQEQGHLGTSISIECHHVQECKRREQEWKKMGRSSTYLNSKGGHEASIVELLIVQLLPKLVDIGHTRTPHGILSIGHGEQGKHELRWIHRYLWGHPYPPIGSAHAPPSKAPLNLHPRKDR